MPATPEPAAPARRYYLHLENSDMQTEVTVGAWVLVDPTGRRLNDCLEVGWVEALYEPAPEGYPGPDCDSASIRLNSGGTVTATEIRAVLGA